MRINAYVLAADPAWIEASILSYYGVVDRIVISYDRDGLGYSGLPVAVDECLRRVRAIDRLGKCDFRPGPFAHPDRRPMDNETAQRRVALAQAGEDADWVLQLDSDEVVPDAGRFRDCVHRAAAAGFVGLDFPSLWLYCGIPGTPRFLAWCRRGGRLDVTYPGALAVRRGAELKVARRPVEPTYRVDVRPRSRFNGERVRTCEVVPLENSVVHLSMVRSDAELRRKFGTWSHSRDMDWSPELHTWRLARRYPRAASVISQLDLSPRRRHLLPVAISPAAVELMRHSPSDVRDLTEPPPDEASGGLIAAVNAAYLTPGVRRVMRAARRRVGRLRRAVGLAPDPCPS